MSHVKARSASHLAVSAGRLVKESMNGASLQASWLNGYLLPGWLILILLLVAGVYMLAMLAMPFSVIGVKSRLEAIEDQLDAIRDELRVISLRQPDFGQASSIEEAPYGLQAGIRAPRPHSASSADFAMPQPPIPPAPAQTPDIRESLVRGRGAETRMASAASPRSRRIEPRLD